MLFASISTGCPANQVLQKRISYLLKRPVGRPPNEARRFHANFTYQAGSRTKPRRVIAKVEWHSGELYPRVGFIVTNMSRPAESVVAFYNKRGTCEQWIKEGKGAIKWTRLSCRTFAANAVRLQLHALAYNLGNFPRTLATPELIKNWSLTTLREKLIKIGAKVVHHGRYVAFQMAEVAILHNLFADILRMVAELRSPPVASSCTGPALSVRPFHATIPLILPRLRERGTAEERWKGLILAITDSRLPARPTIATQWMILLSLRAPSTVLRMVPLPRCHGGG